MQKINKVGHIKILPSNEELGCLYVELGAPFFAIVLFFKSCAASLLLFDAICPCVAGITVAPWNFGFVWPDGASLDDIMTGDLGDDDILTSKLVTSPLATTVLWLPYPLENDPIEPAELELLAQLTSSQPIVQPLMEIYFNDNSK